MKLLSPKDLSNKSETQEIKIIRDEIVQYDNDRKKKNVKTIITQKSLQYNPQNLYHSSVTLKSQLAKSNPYLGPFCSFLTFCKHRYESRMFLFQAMDVFDSVVNIVAKNGKCYQHFLFFPQCFQQNY
jgi:hypothetical protein